MTSYFSKHVGDTVSQIKWIFVVSVCYIARYKIEIIFGEINIKVFHRMLLLLMLFHVSAPCLRFSFMAGRIE